MARRKQNLLFNLTILLSLIVGLLFSPAPVHAAAVINVTTFNDEFNATGTENDCSLREAIYAANYDTAYGGCPAGSGFDTIILQATPPSTPYALTINSGATDEEYGDLDILSGMQIVGKGSGADGTGTVISGQTHFRIFDIFMDKSLGPTQVSLQHMRIQDGNAAGSRDNDPNGAGGGIYNYRSLLSLFDVVVINNQATNSGGGIYSCWNAENCSLTMASSTISSNTLTGNDPNGGGAGIMSKGLLLITNSLIEKNAAQYTIGGGLWNQSDPSARLVNVTFSQNKSGEKETGVANSGAAVYSSKSLELINNTIAENTVYNSAAAALDLQADSVIINTILALNKFGTNAANCNFFIKPYGAKNLIDGDEAECVYSNLSPFDKSGSINISMNEDPDQYLRGYTQGYKLNSGSFAIDYGASSYTTPGGKKYYCPGSDYRWAIRPMKGKAGAAQLLCDVGAYEANNVETGVAFYDPVTLPLIIR